jgi:predicted nuclease of predicted toxin-antitoxin system
MILADENIRTIFIVSLRKNNIDVYSIKELDRGISDFTITELSLFPPRIILTRDKDFGDLAFLHKTPMTGCILLRYDPIDEEEIVVKLILFLENESIETLSQKFITITTNKIRISSITN